MSSAPLSPDPQDKLLTLRSNLRAMRRVLIAYSGGVDSGFLAWVARQELRDDMLAVLADSPSLARWQMQDAVSFASEHGIPLTIVETGELEREEYRRNDTGRCFHCKDELFTVMERFRHENGFDSIAYGVNVDDQSDFRPGQAAARQHGIAAPLLDAGMTKDDIRRLAHQSGLRIWDKPASPCLSSRVAYGLAVTPEVLATVEAGEDALRRLGFRQFRVRHHGEVVRLEIAKDELPRSMTPEMAAEFTRIFRALGYACVTLDLEGFRSGSMNAFLPAESLVQKP
jgi:uncharacterized protein